jgi:hypothetical protein
MQATWYVTEAGDAVDPNECAIDDSGALVHKSGAKIAMRAPDLPRSTGVDLDALPKATADMNPAPKPQPQKRQGYKTRGS